MAGPPPRRGLFFLLPFGAVLILAFGFTTLGPTLAWALPRLAWWEASLLAAAPFLAVVAAGLPLGRAGDRLGHGRILLLGLALLPAGLALPLAGGSFPFLLAAFVVIGLSFIAVSAAVNPLVAGLFPERLGSALTLLHTGWSVGAFAGPVVAGLLLAGGDIRALFVLAAGLSTIFLAVSAPLSRRLPGPPVAAPRREFRFSTPLLLLVLLGFFYSGAEMGLNTWLPAYLQATGAADPAEAGLALGAFWGAMGLGRVAVGPLLDRFGIRRVALLMAILALATLVANGLLPGGPAPLRWGLTGFAFSILFPAGMAFAARLFPEDTGAAVGAVFGLGILGAVAVPGLIGILQPLLGPGAVLLCVTGSLVALVAVLLHPRLAEVERAAGAGQ